MKYTFTNEQGIEKTVTIEDAWIAKQKKLLGITNREAILMWLSDEGYIEDPTITELTQKAKQGGAVAKGERKQRKAPVRKPDEVKRAIIAFLEKSIRESDAAVVSSISNIEVTNIERVIAFSLGTDKYELTLSKKRAPKK